MSFLNARDVDAIRDHALAMRERADQILGILNRDQQRGGAPPSRQGKEPIPDGAWKGEPASQKQIDTLQKGKIEIWDGITKGEASKLIEDLFKGRSKK